MDEGAALGDIGRDGLLAEDVLAGGEGLADYVWLDSDGQDDDDGVDVGAGKKGVERAVCVLVVVDVELVGELEGLFGGLCKLCRALVRAGVDRLEIDGGSECSESGQVGWGDGR